MMVVWRIPAEQFCPSNDPGYCLRVDWMDGKPEDFGWISRISPKSYISLDVAIYPLLSLFFIYMHPFTHFHLHLNWFQRTDRYLGDVSWISQILGKFCIFCQIPRSPSQPPVPKLLKGGHWRHCQKYEYICNTQQIINQNSYFGCKS